MKDYSYLDVVDEQLAYRAQFSKPLRKKPITEFNYLDMVEHMNHKISVRIWTTILLFASLSFIAPQGSEYNGMKWYAPWLMLSVFASAISVVTGLLVRKEVISQATYALQIGVAQTPFNGIGGTQEDWDAWEKVKKRWLPRKRKKWSSPF